MKNKDEYPRKISDLILRCKKVIANEWESLTFVFDLGEGHIANSGFLYNGDRVRPVTARISEDPMLLSDTIREFRAAVEGDCGEKFKQLLVQMEKKSGRFRIDFEFDDGQRWRVIPSGGKTLKEIREDLKPSL
ncbi:hypothetical protein [Agaribacterium sp. ZY112]|uniref:hypothetical protein n=1 Tax=Agaribacterium sp. ZY112 TaxID=3233574 RepID=UPI0035233ED8